MEWLGSRRARDGTVPRFLLRRFDPIPDALTQLLRWQPACCERHTEPFMRIFLGLVLLALSAATSAQDFVTGPLVGRWDYGYLTCGDDSKWGYADEQPALVDGVHARYTPTYSCPWNSNPGEWGTPQRETSGPCSTSSDYPKFAMGIESQNRRRHTVNYSFHAPTCGSWGKDGMTTGRARPVVCPFGYTPWGNVCKRPVGVPDRNKNCDTCPAGSNGTNPIHNALGNKRQTEVDFDVGGGLAFTRYYSSESFWGRTDIGENWRHSYHAGIFVPEAPASGAPVTAWVVRPDGSWYAFNKVSDENWVPENDVTLRLEATYSSPGVLSGWILRTRESITETYDAKGYLIRIERPSALPLHLAYHDGLLESVTDDRGRAIVFVRGINGTITDVVEPSGATHHFTYDAVSNLVSVERPAASGLTPPQRIYHYEDASLDNALTGITDENGDRYATWAYNASRQATLSVHGDANATVDRYVLTFNADGTTTVVDPLERSRNYTFMQSYGVKRMTGVTGYCPTCGTGTVQSVTYDANGHVDTTTDFNGVVTDYEYDARGLKARVIESANRPATKRTTQTDWHATFAEPTERRLLDAGDSVVVKENWTYNSRGQVLTRTRHDVATGQSRTTTTTYCEQADVNAGSCPIVGLVKAIDGPRTDVADITTFTYYASDEVSCATSPTTCAYRRGDLWRKANAAGRVSEFLAYDGAGRVKSLRDENGVTTEFEYDARGKMSARKMRGTNSSTESDDAVTKWEHDAVGQVTRVVRPDASFAAFTYDEAHRLTKVADSFGHFIQYTLDDAGNRTVEETRTAANVLKRTLSRDFDELGRPHESIDAYGKATIYVLDSNGEIDTVTDPLGRMLDSDRDALGNLERSIANANGSGVERATTAYGFDAVGNLTRVTDPKGLVTQYAYNGFGDLLQLSSPDTGVTTYGYDAGGDLVSKTDARGVTSLFTFDALGRATNQDVPTTGQDVSISYDTPVAGDCPAGETFGVGRASRMTDESGSTSYCYNRFGYLARKKQVITTGSTLTVQYTYNNAGNLVGITYPSGASATFIRNADGKINQVLGKPSATGAQVGLVTGTVYEPFGPIRSMTYGTGRVLYRAYDLNYNIDASNDGVPADGFYENYTLDDIGNVVGINERASTYRSYEYDGLNRLKAEKSGSTVVEAFTYDATGNRLTKVAGGVTQSYAYPTDSHRLGGGRTYDASGNIVVQGGFLLPHDDHGRLRQFHVNGVHHQSYVYNGIGERVMRIGVSSPAVTLQFVYDEAGHLLGEYSSTGARVAEYVWHDDTLVAVFRPHDGTTYQLVETDYLGTPRVVVNPANSATIWRWDVTPTAFGDHAPATDPDGNGIAYNFNLRFPGQYYMGLDYIYYNRFRDVDARTGRYLQSDPIGLYGDISTYAYVSSTPLGAIDPKGLKAGGQGVVNCGLTKKAGDFFFSMGCDWVGRHYGLCEKCQCEHAVAQKNCNWMDFGCRSRAREELANCTFMNCEQNKKE
jgi:RHS repeat-associated protein